MSDQEEKKELSVLDRLFGRLEEEEKKELEGKEPDQPEEKEQLPSYSYYEGDIGYVHPPILDFPIPSSPEIDEDDEEESTEDDEDADDQDENEGMLFGSIFPYRQRFALPTPEPTVETASRPVTIVCRICHENMINTVTFPCHHAAMCVSCARDYGRVQNACPICRTQLQSIDRIYITFTEHEEPQPPESSQPNKRRRLDPDP